MAYSLKNHEDRIAKLESKIGTGGGIIESSLTNPGYVKFANGFTMNWGSGRGSTTMTFKKPFTTAVLAFTVGVNNSSYFAGNKSDYIHLHSATLTTIKSLNGADGTLSFFYLAIGYLISNRILNYISKFLNSVKNLKAVI